MRWHEEVLDRDTAATLSAVGPVLSGWGFYLGGGTAVALQLGHRRSMDLDWFTEAPFKDASILASELREAGVELELGEVARGTVHGRVSGTPLSLMEYPYPLLEEPLEHEALGCRVAPLEDLACMKLSAIAQRGSAKDFLDIYAVARERIPLDRMLDLYRSKYSVEDISHVLYGLAYFDDADRERLPVLLWDVRWEEVKAAVRDWVGAFGRLGT